MKDVKFIKPDELSIAELEGVRTFIYKLPDDDLIKTELGKRVRKYLTKVSEELAKKTGIGHFKKKS